MPSERSYSLLIPPDPNLLCPICHSVLKSPWMSVVCEHFYCRDCILRSLETSALCPCDRQPLSQAQLVPALRLVQLIVDELKVQCDDTRCTWRGQRSQWEKHPCAAALGQSQTQEGEPSSSTGGSRAIPCKWSGCTVEFRRKTDILKHEESECPVRMSACEQCGESVNVNDLEVDHTSVPLKRFTLLSRRALCSLLHSNTLHGVLRLRSPVRTVRSKAYLAQLCRYIKVHPALKLSCRVPSLDSAAHGRPAATPSLTTSASNVSMSPSRRICSRQRNSWQ